MKIAVITNGPHFTIGGVEKYSETFYQFFGTKHQITEFPTLKIKNSVGNNAHPNSNVKIDYSLLGWKPHLMVWGGTYTSKNYKNIFENYDLVIINATFIPSRWLFNQKAIIVQHMHKKWYSLLGKNWKLSLGMFFSSLLFGVGTITNSFKNAQNVVFFTKETKAFTRAKNVFFIPLAHKSAAQICLKKTVRNYFAFIGRIDNQQKNIDDLIKIANLNEDVLIYGLGCHQKMLMRKLKNINQFKGVVPKQKIDETIKHLKCLILTSHYEGFPFVIVEALSNGTPVIAFDTFKSLDFFVKSDAVFLIKPGEVNDFNQKIAWLRNLNDDQYQKISNNALKFALEHLTKENFWLKWEQVINNFQSKSTSNYGVLSTNFLVDNLK